MIPAKILDHTAQMLAKLTDEFKGRAKIEATLKAFGAAVQEAEDYLWQIIEGTMLPPFGTAAGFQLDQIGSLVNEPRQGRADVDYLPALRIRIRANRSKGRAEDLIQIAKIAQTVTPANYTEHYPHGWVMTLFDIPGGPWLARILFQAKMITTHGNVILAPEYGMVWADDASLGTFGWNYDDVPALADGHWCDDY